MMQVVAKLTQENLNLQNQVQVLQKAVLERERKVTQNIDNSFRF